MNKKVAVISITFILLVLFCFLALPAYTTIPETNYGAPSTSCYESMIWLKTNTPPDAIILAWWDYGYLVKYIAEREAIITPSQETELIPVVARYFLSYDNPPPPFEADYIIVDDLTSDAFLPAISFWAGYEYTSLANKQSLAKRLYDYTLPSQLPGGYHLVFDNGIKIYEYGPLKEVSE